MQISSNDITKRIYRQSGFRGFFAGLDAQIARDMAFYAAFFGSYEVLCDILPKVAPFLPENGVHFMSGGFAGICGWLFTMPLDVPKTIVQSNYSSRTFGDYIPALKTVYRKRGFIGLYSGIGPSLLRAFPANAALFTGVEFVKKEFDNIF